MKLNIGKLANDPANIRRVIDKKISAKKLSSILQLNEAETRKVMKRIRLNAARQKPMGQSLNDIIGKDDIIDYGRDRYTYNRKTDKYIFPIAGKSGRHSQPLVVRGEAIRSICAAYSDENGTPATINELAKEFSLPKNVIKEVVKRLDRTHDLEPITKEEYLTLDSKELIDRLYQQKRADLAHERDVHDWKQIVDKANKWDHADVFITDEFRSLIKDKAYSVKKQPMKKSPMEYMAILGLSDLHYGKYASADESYDPYDIETTKERVLRHTANVMAQLESFGRPEKIVIPVGSDFFHVDTYTGTTTKGTAQDMVGTPGDIMRGGALLMRNVVDLCREVAPVELVMLEGNHDRLAGQMLFMYLSAAYENCKDVTTVNCTKPQVFISYGKNLIGFAHSDGVRRTKDLGGLMAMLAPDEWAVCPHRVFYTGNYHFEKVEVDEFFSIVKRQIPSLSGTDRWHSINGYTNTRKALPLYLHDKENGLTAVFYSNEQ